MTEPSLAAQRYVATRLKSVGAVTAHVPAANIFDRSGRPEVFPCVIVGEGLTVDDSGECVIAAEVSLDLDVWTRETGFLACKTIAGEIMRALRGMDVEQDGVGLTLASLSARYLRDPSGANSHAVISLDILAEGDGE